MANQNRITCNEVGCSNDFKHLKSLRKHLTNVHNQIHPKITKVFASEDGYSSWKSTYESENNVTYSQYDCSRRNGVTKYLRCNLSKTERNFTNSSKMDEHCTSCMTVKIKTSNITVELFPTHYNHKHMKINKKINQNLYRPWE